MGVPPPTGLSSLVPVLFVALFQKVEFDRPGERSPV